MGQADSTLESFLGDLGLVTIFCFSAHFSSLDPLSQHVGFWYFNWLQSAYCWCYDDDDDDDDIMTDLGASHQFVFPLLFTSTDKYIPVSILLGTPKTNSK